MMDQFNVLIVEDDFRVAGITQGYVEKVPGFSVSALAKTAAETKEELDKGSTPDVVLLDVYIPDAEGMSLFHIVREACPAAAIIFITAARETETIAKAFQGGAFDYLVKPLEFSRLKQSLERFARQRRILASKKELNQAEIDSMQQQGEMPEEAAQDHLPKGIDRLTLDKFEELFTNQSESMTAAEVGRQIGASRSTARRYLEYLVSVGAIAARLKYGDVGRPERRYEKERS
jgi:response regulator of citrate/malate metabolism